MAEDGGYNIVFHGKLVAGADPARVRENLAKLFKMDPERVEKLFAGKPVVLKKNADQATAMKMRAALKKAGAECEMRSLEEPDAPESAPEPSGAPQSGPSGAGGDTGAQPAPPQSGQPEAASSAQPPGAAAASGVSMEDKPQDLETVGTIRTGGTGFSGEFEVAPAGAELEELHSGEAPVDPDISHLSMAPPGTELEQLKENEEIEVPDISHLRVVDDTGSPEGQG